jgi:tRNA threonylcarbamoyl adenosine modification protein YeaZ
MTTKNLTLAIDSTENEISVVLTRGDLLLSSALKRSNHVAEDLLSLISQCLENAALGIKDIETIAIALGPGSFTGIRSGLACAKGLALGAKCRLVGASVLHARAICDLREDNPLVVSIPANERELYFACLTLRDSPGPEISSLIEINYCKKTDLAERVRELLSQNNHVHQGGIELPLDYLDASMNELSNKYQSNYQIAAYWISQWANKYARSENESDLVPLYIKPVHAKTIAERQGES